MQSEEVIIKAKNITDSILSLPKDVSFGEKLFSNNNESVLGFKKITSYQESKAEMHENYADIFLIKEGSEEFFIGGEIINKELKSIGEWTGDSLINAKKYNIEAGDVVIIPKGVPHMHGKGIIKLIVIKIG